MNKDALEQELCDTCGYEEGSIYCKEHCPHEAKIEQEPREESKEVPCDNCKYLDGDGCRLVFEQIEYGKASDECPNDNNVSTKNTVSGDAISRKIILAFLSGLISDETERKKALEYINELPPVVHQETVTEFADRCRECGKMRKGHWIAKRIGIIDRELYCDQCGEEALADYPSRFCSNCGAKMIGDIKDIESQERSE